MSGRPNRVKKTALGSQTEIRSRHHLAVVAGVGRAPPLQRRGAGGQRRPVQQRVVGEAHRLRVQVQRRPVVPHLAVVRVVRIALLNRTEAEIQQKNIFKKQTNKAALS